jgi:hypothetical protein
LCLCDLVVFHAVGHAVEGQFVVDVGAEGHGSPLSTLGGGRKRSLVAIHRCYGFFS